jgi:hypothetical protein
MADDPILSAKTVTELCQALIQVYGLNLPVSFDAGTVLATLWGFSITVAKDPEPGTLYEATATTSYPFGKALDGTLVVDVLEST